MKTTWWIVRSARDAKRMAAKPRRLTPRAERTIHPCNLS